MLAAILIFGHDVVRCTIGARGKVANTRRISIFINSHVYMSRMTLLFLPLILVFFKLGQSVPEMRVRASENGDVSLLSTIVLMEKNIFFSPIFLCS